MVGVLVRPAGQVLDVAAAAGWGGAMGDHAGKNVVITGGTSGFGFTTARLLTEGGAWVLITGRDPDRLAAARAQLGGSVVTVRSDAASPADIDALADRVDAELGTVDALFVNAVSPGPIDTGVLRRSMPVEVAERLEAEFVARNPMGRMGESVEVARAVLFLAFEATFTTGAELTVDGGASQL
jgi:NAD(P)-dependent dehydrogenase (short-subunit alcohol dehydrogenase family)